MITAIFCVVKIYYTRSARDPSRRAFLRLSSLNVVKDLEEWRLLEDDGGRKAHS